MKKTLTYLRKSIPGSLGIYEFFRGLIEIPGFISDYNKLVTSANATKTRFPFRGKDIFPCLLDNTKTTPFDPHYTYHPAWAARVVARIMPKKHIDISSTLRFSTIVSAFVPVDFYDYRPAELKLNNLASKHGDLMALPFADNSVESISCMHTIEHIGLGRYGDPIDYDADLKAINELVRVLAPGGTLIFVTPVGKPKIEFNAHRIYSYEQIAEYFNKINLIEFSLVPDDWRKYGLIENAEPSLVKDQDYGCGCFVFTK